MTTAQLPPLVGNRQLLQQLSGQRLGHAFILSGPEGSGRHTLANRLAQTILCRSPREGQPCGSCSDCRKVAAGIHPDLLRINGITDKGKRLAVGEARGLLSDAYIAPNEAARKLYFFDQAGELSEAVQNVLLKLIEDGPPFCSFLLLVQHSGQLLPTVRSRCEELKLQPVPTEEAVAWLSRRFPQKSEEDLRHAAIHSNGILGTAVQLLEQGTLDGEGLPLARLFCTALAQKDEVALAALIARNEKATRDELIAMCQQCNRLFHSALRLTAEQTATLEGELSADLAQLGKDRLFRLDRLFREAITRLEGNAQTGILLGWLAVTCAELL